MLSSEVSYDRTNSSLSCFFSVNCNSLTHGRKNIVTQVVKNNFFFFLGKLSDRKFRDISVVENQWWSSLMHWRYHYSTCCSYGVCQCILSHRVIILQGDWWRAEGEQVGEKSGLWHSISPTSFVVSDFFGLSSCMLKLSDVCESNAHLNFEAWCSLYYFN